MSFIIRILLGALLSAAHATPRHGAQNRPPRIPVTHLGTRRSVVGGSSLAAFATLCPCCRVAPAGARENAVFAAAMATGSGPHERKTRARKLDLFAQLDSIATVSEGETRTDDGQRLPVLVELGVGTGPNLALFPQRVRQQARIVGVEPNTAMHPYAQRAASEAGVASFEIVEASAEAMPFQSGSVDAVVCTLTLCSVASQSAVLREVRRVLKPGGRFLFMEHVLSEDDALLAAMQRAVDPLQGLLADGCHVTRRTRTAIDAAGFASVDAHDFTVPGLWVVGPHVSGVAIA